MAARSVAQRKADVLAKLAGDDDAWVATASAAGRPHLVPLSLAWDDHTVIVTVEATSVTARNVAATGVARVALGATRDVVMIDAAAELVEASQLDDERADLFARRTGWDPRPLPEDWVYLLLRPQRVQAWREVDEIEGRTLMRGAAWVV
jgi:Pyridoxamine 5'-phosphate oxidase